MKTTNTDLFLRHPIVEEEVEKTREPIDKIQQMGAELIFKNIYVFVCLCMSMRPEEIVGFLETGVNLSISQPH